MTRKCKLFTIHDYVDDFDNQVSKIGDGFNDWEELEEEDYQLLKHNMHLLNKWPTSHMVVLVEAGNPSIKEAYNSINDFIKKEKKRLEEEAKKREEAKVARQMAAALKKEKSEKALFEKLKKKFEES